LKPTTYQTGSNIVVHKHYGQIKVVSEPGETRFRVVLPVRLARNNIGATKRACELDRRDHMSEQENCNTLEHLFQAFARHDLDAIDDLMRDDYI
jgi:hypothetical protein